MPGGADYFEAVVRAGAAPKSASNWVQGELQRTLKAAGATDAGASRVPPEALAELAIATDRGEVSSSVAKDVFAMMWETGRRAADIIRDEGLGQIGDEAALAGIVSRVLEANPQAVAEARMGKASVFGYLVGQVMKASGGKANPTVVGGLIRAWFDSDKRPA
jgi:aspartyl-tRNA(Asn)/glutamyl-tRNA(Gln) amidotransferase subunit B